MAEGLDRGIHAVLLIPQAGLERLPQLHSSEILVELLREDQRRTSCKRPGPSSPFRPRARVDAYDFLQLVVIERLIARRLVHLGDLEARLESWLDRPGKLFYVTLVRVQRAIPVLGLLVKVSCDEQRLAA